MALSLLPVDQLPSFGSVVFCKWPSEPIGNPARRVLVIDAEIRTHDDGFDFGVVRIAYGSGNLSRPEASSLDIVVDDRSELLTSGLTKPTRFYLSKPYVRWLVWTDAKFVSPNYLAEQGIYCGRLSPARLSALQQNMTVLDRA